MAGIAINSTSPQIRMSLRPADRRSPGKDVDRKVVEVEGDVMAVFQKLKDGDEGKLGPN